MLSCRDVTEQGSEYIDRNLPLGKRLQFYTHLFICNHCRRYLRQLRTTIGIVKLKPITIDDKQAKLVVEKILEQKNPQQKG